MISEDDKIQALGLISETCKAGARKGKAAWLLGLPIRTVQRWEEHGLSDNRKGSRAVPANKISEDEKEKIVAVLKSPEFGDSNPNQIVPKLADQGIYMGSESTMYRILRDMNVVRLNFAQGTWQGYREDIRRNRTVAARLQHHCLIRPGTKFDCKQTKEVSL